MFHINSCSIFLLFSLLIFSYCNSISVHAHSKISFSSNDGGLQLRRTPSRRSLLSHNDGVDAKQDKTIFVSPDGTIYLVEQNSGELLFSLPTGPSISSLCRNSSSGDGCHKESSSLVDYLDDKYTVDIGGGLLHTEDSGEMNLMKIVEDYFSGAPYVSIDEASIGKTKLTVFVIDSSNGKVISILDPNDIKNALSQKVTTNKEKFQPLFVKRSDYELLSFSLKSKKLLWNLTFSRIEASFVNEEWESQVPVVHMRDATHVQFLLEISRIIYKGIKPFLATKGNEYSKFLVDADNTAKATALIEKRNQNMISAEKEGLNSNENKMPYDRRLQFIAVSWFLLVFIMWYAGIITITSRKSTTSTTELNSPGGKNTVVLKKKKARKMEKHTNNANIKSVARSTFGDHLDKFNNLSSDKRNSQRPLSNLEIPVGADMDGRNIGKLFISNTEIAKGSNGTIVIEGIYDGRPVAVKRLLRVHHDIAYKEIQNLIVSDRHPNIVRWYGVEYDADFVYLSLERCTCNLGDFIKMFSRFPNDLVLAPVNRKYSMKEFNVQSDITKRINKKVDLWKAMGYPTPQLLRLMRDIVSGLVHLHELGIIHRDLKPENVLINSERSLCAKLSDMGISKRLVENKSSLGDHPTGYGSSGWQAPEQLLHGRQTRAVDMFSLGCVLFFCITGGRHPFGEHLERDINIVNNRVNLFIVEHIPEAVDLFSHLLNPNPDLRPVASYVLHHPLFWSSETRLSFIRDASDRVELEDRENTSDLLKALENVGPVALGGYWDKKLEMKFINDIGRYRRYKFDSTRDLLRVMRNKLNHYRELPKDIQELIGQVPEGFDKYFSCRFPNLLIEVYKVIYGYCREEECFQKYFKTV